MKGNSTVLLSMGHVTQAVHVSWVQPLHIDNSRTEDRSLTDGWSPPLFHNDESLDQLSPSHEPPVVPDDSHVGYRQQESSSLALILFSSLSGANWTNNAILKWSYVSVLSFVKQSKMAQARPFRKIGTQRSFFAASQPLAAAHTWTMVWHHHPTGVWTEQYQFLSPHPGFQYQCNNSNFTENSWKNYKLMWHTLHH